ncbi:MAG: hypothetical protein EBY35_15535, partial [Rhodobacteraceae bacterium]|nr:hypothetical protein [Paracoccaceae bacterium]
MSQQMRVIEITKAGDPSVLKPASRSVPDPKYGDVLIKIAFAGVNRPDALQRAGLYNPPPTASDLPGVDNSGEIVASPSPSFKEEENGAGDVSEFRKSLANLSRQLEIDKLAFLHKTL